MWRFTGSFVVMKYPRFMIIAALFLLLSCGKKTYTAIETPAPPLVQCKDTFGTALFVNTKTTEIRLILSSKTSTKEGNVVVNTWKNYSTINIKAGDSTRVVLPANKQFMYTVYAPVSGNVQGYGVVAEDKFIISPCEMRSLRL